MGKKKKKMSKEQQEKLIEFVKGKAKEKEAAKEEAKKEKELQTKLMEEALKPAEPLAPPQASQTTTGDGTSMTTYYVIGGVGVLVLGLAAFFLLRKPAASSTK